MAQRRSFRDPVTQVLKAHGYVTQNAPGDLAQAEAESFNLRPRDGWRWDGAQWVPYTFPRRRPRAFADIRADIQALSAGDRQNLLAAMAAEFLREHPAVARRIGLGFDGDEPVP